MTVKNITRLLERALLRDGDMRHELYKYELEEILDDLKSSMMHDKDDYIFVVTENRGHVAMVLIEQSGQVHVNEQVRNKLKTLWSAAYEGNMKKLIPVLARQLNRGELPINGVRTVKSFL